VTWLGERPLHVTRRWLGNHPLVAVAREKIPFERRRRWRQHLQRAARPAWFGTLRRTTPLSDGWGYDRGNPVDRYYIEGFLKTHRADIHGRILEVRDSRYTDRFGVGVECRDVLDIDASNPRATIVADLAAADAIPSGLFDCFVLTQTLQFIYDTHAALVHAHRILRRGGVLLATVPALSRVSFTRADSEYWRFTGASCAQLFGSIFGADHTSVHVYGNVLTAIAFLMGLAAEELSLAELNVRDPSYPVIVAVRGVKQ
jgi:hypothetical protein